MEGGLSQLKEKRGVLLFQLPPNFGYDPGRLDRFLAKAPSGQRLSVEFRHPSWDREKTFTLLKRHGAAYCITSGANLSCVLARPPTSSMSASTGPISNTSMPAHIPRRILRWWADRIGEWRSQGLDVLAYFNNDGYGNAVRNALRLRELVGE